MKLVYWGLLAGTLMLAGCAFGSYRDQSAREVSPIFGVAIPNGYRQWELIAPAQEAAPLDELRAAWQ
jgi:hypothetical protein